MLRASAKAPEDAAVLVLGSLFVLNKEMLGVLLPNLRNFKNDVFLSINHLLMDTYILRASVHVFAIVFFQVIMTLPTPITL